MKRTISLLLALLLAASLLTACTQKDSFSVQSNVPEPQTPNVELTTGQLLGAWQITLNLANAEMVGATLNNSSFPQEVAEELLTDLELPLSMDLHFYADGTVDCVIDKDSFIQMYDTLAEKLIDYIVNGGIEKIVEANGMTMEEYQAKLADQNMTLDDVLAQFDTTYRQIINGKVFYNSLRAGADGDVSTTEDNFQRFDEAGNIIYGQPYTLSPNALTFHVDDDSFFSSGFDTDLVAEYHFDGKTVTFTDANDTLVYNQTMTKIS